ICWKYGSLSDSQQEPRAPETRQPAGNRRCKRSHAPQQRSDAANKFYAKAIQQQARRKLARSVRPAIGAQQIPERYRRDAKRRVKRVFRDGEIYAVDVIHQDAESE